MLILRGYAIFPFIAVNIACNEQTNAKRLCSRERADEAGKGKTKLVDEKELLSLRKEYRLLDEATMAREAKDVDFYHLNLDTSDMSIQAASISIGDFLQVTGLC